MKLSIRIARALVVSCLFAASHTAVAQDQQVTDGPFSLRIPRSWTRLAAAETSSLRQAFVQQSEEMYKQYYGRSEGYDVGVPHLVGFRNALNSATLVLIVLKQPPQADTYLDEIFTRAGQVMDYGKRTGRISAIHRVARSDLAGIHGVLTDAVDGKSNREIVYTLFSDDRRDRGVIVYVSLPAARYQVAWPELNTVLSSLRIDLKRVK